MITAGLLMYRSAPFEVVEEAAALAAPHGLRMFVDLMEAWEEGDRGWYAV